jgi:hypothetical protein
MKKKLLIAFFLNLTLSPAFAQNVGIGIPNPSEKLDVDGFVRSRGLQVRSGGGYIELGAGIVGKEVNAGKIGYGLFGGLGINLDIVGAGSGSTPRRIRMWAEGGTRFEGPLNVSNINTYTGLTNDKINVNAFAKLGGDGHAAIKTKYFMGTSGTVGTSTEGSFVYHDVPINRIVSATVFIVTESGQLMPPNNFTIGGSVNQYEFYMKYNYAYIRLKAPNCNAICNRPVILYITYTDVALYPLMP